MPYIRCCLCPNKYPNFTLHRFPPARHHNVFLQWLDIMPEKIKETDPATVRKKYVVCESHFNRDDYFAVSGKRRLKWNSLPKLKATDCATPKMNRTSSSMGCTPKSTSRYRSILSTVEGNVDKSPEIEVVSLGLHDIPGNSSDNICIENISMPSTDEIQAPSEIENTPKQDHNRNARKRTITSTGTLKRRRLYMTEGSTLSSELMNVNDAPLSIDMNCPSTSTSEIPEGEDITLVPARPTSEITMQSATAVSLASIGNARKRTINTTGVAKKRRLYMTEGSTLSSELMNVNDAPPSIDMNCPSTSMSEVPEGEDIAFVPTRPASEITMQSATAVSPASIVPVANDPISRRKRTIQRKRVKAAVNQLAQIISNTNKENVSTTTATLRQRNRGCYRRRRRYQSKYTRLRKSLKEDIKKGLEQFCYSKLNEPTCDFIRMQIENQEKKQKGRRWTMRYKAMAALWLKLGPRSYNVLRRLWFALPSRRTIMRLLSDVAFKPGINEGVMQSLKETVSSMNDREKICYITFDEMSCHEGLHYDIKEDIIVGFKDLGGDSREPVFAHQVMVVMVRGIARAWKQAIAYYFTKVGMDSINIKVMVKDVITKLHDIGLQVLATVCDASTSNISAITSLKEETRIMFLRKGEENRHFGFLVEGKEVIPLFDPPHLMKAFRNNFLKKHLVFKLDNKWYEASWSDIVTLYEHDCTDAVTRNCPKLTVNHIDPEKGGKMKVKYATQVFSHQVFCCFRSFIRYGVFANKERAEGTAQLVWFFDQLFDSVNGYKKKVEKDQFLYCVVTEASNHLSFWDKAIQTLSSMEFKTTGRDHKIPPCLVQWIETVKGFKYLWELLRDQYNFKFLTPRNINQDGLENFFSGIRSNSGQNVNPTIYQFIGSFKTMLISSCASIKAPGSNCKLEKYDEVLSPILSLIQNSKKLQKEKRDKRGEDEDVLITHLEFLENMNLESSDPDEDFDDVTVELSDMAKCCNKELFVYNVKKSTRFYLAGYMAKRAAKRVSHCADCKMELFTADVTKYAEWVLLRQRGQIRKLKLPDTKFFSLFSQMYDVAKMALPQISHRAQVRSLLKHIIRKSLQGKFFFSCTHHNLFEIVLNLFTIFYIRVWILNVNRILNGKDLRQVDDEIKRLALEVLKKRTGRVKKVAQMKSK